MMLQQAWGRSDEVCGPVAWHRARDEDRSSCVWRRWWRGVPRPPQQGGQDEEAAVAQAESLRGRPHGHGARRVADQLPGVGHWWTVWGEKLHEVSMTVNQRFTCCVTLIHFTIVYSFISHLNEVQESHSLQSWSVVKVTHMQRSQSMNTLIFTRNIHFCLSLWSNRAWEKAHTHRNTFNIDIPEVFQLLIEYCCWDMTLSITWPGF